MTALIDAYDAALFDLDGVIYLGPVAVPGAADGVAELRRRGVAVGFVTNNAARPPESVAAHLVELGIAAEVTTSAPSAQAAVDLVVARFGHGATVLAVGGAGVHAAVAEGRLTEVASADERPQAVVQGWGPELTWAQLNEAAIAIHRGAHWVATNTDPTRPTDRGLVPGNGAAVTAVRTAVGVDPEVAGKPFRPLMEATIARLGAQRPLFVGDRLDTDIAGANGTGLDSLLVLTGSHGAADLLRAVPAERPTHLGYDLADLTGPPRSCQRDGDVVRCGDQQVRWQDETLQLEGLPTDRRSAVDALWAAAALTWALQDGGTAVDTDEVAARLGSAIASGRG